MIGGLKNAKVLLLLMIFPACTGSPTATPSVDKGGIVITPGESLTVDLQDVTALNISNYTVTLESITPDFANAAPLFDLTAFAQAQLSASGTPSASPSPSPGSSNTSSSFAFILPKSVTAAKPFLIVVNFPEINTQLIDVVYDGMNYVRPGIASTMTYNLMKDYAISDLTGKMVAVKNINQYSGNDFASIRALIQAKIDYLLSISEYISLATTPYKKLVRYFTNGVAFDITFLTTIRQYGIIYSGPGLLPLQPLPLATPYAASVPTGLKPLDTPEGPATGPDSTDPTKLNANYKYAGGPFTVLVNGQSKAAAMNPFNQTNSPPQMMQGVASPNPGDSIFVSEGTNIQVTAEGFDLDDDYMNKSMIVQYIPRVLPSAITSLVFPEPTPSYTVMTNLSGPNSPDTYTSAPIGYNEALDTNYYHVDGDTAYRNVYYILTDGMILIPYRWNFKYSDVNRQPKIATNSDGTINSTLYDSILDVVDNNQPLPTTPPWFEHASHCETNPNAFYNSQAYQVVHGRGDGPWSCAFVVTDPDLDQDPNAAADVFNYTVQNVNPFAQVMSGDPSPGTLNPRQFIWPPMFPNTLTSPKRVQGKTLPTCTTADGATHFKCGVGLVQITIDNAVKVAAETQSDLQFPYGIMIYDRDQVAGLSVGWSLTRKVEFNPIPARIVNYENFAPDPATADPSTCDALDGGGNCTHVAPLTSEITVAGNVVYNRWDTYLSDILPSFDAFNALGGDLTNVGLDPAEADIATRSRAFMQGSSTEISGYITQPHQVLGNAFTMDGVGNVIAATSGALTYLGNSLTPADQNLYSYPREYDSTCTGIPTNNKNPLDPTDPWDQGTSAGWVFEINAIDYDNVGLRPGEPTDPVYISLGTDVVASLNAAGFQFCSYLAPNSSPLTFQTYQAIPAPIANPALAAVDPEACTWQAGAPTMMQPIPLYFQTTDQTGNPTVQKMVYHRLRMKWQPTDPGGLSALSPPMGYFQNIVKNLNLFGNVLLSTGKTLDQTRPPVHLNLFAAHKDMLPCMSGFNATSDLVLDQANPGAPNGMMFSVMDQNRTIGSMGKPFSLNGRYGAEMTMMGTRGIDHPEFYKFLPYFVDCSSTDTVVPVGPTPPPNVHLNVPEVFYSLYGDAAHTPRVRFEASTVNDQTILPPPTAPNAGQFCFVNTYNPIQNASAQTYNEVILIYNSNRTDPYTLDLTTIPSMVGCTAKNAQGTQAVINVNPDEEYIAIASVCGGNAGLGHTSPYPQQLWSDANSTGSIMATYDPTVFGFPGGTRMSLKLFPSLYGTDYAKVVSLPHDASLLDSINALFFTALPLDTFKLDINQMPSYTGYGNWLSSNTASNFGPSPMGASNMPGYTFEYVDWDNQPIYMGLAAPTPNAFDGSSPNVFFRGAPADSTRLQLYIKNHATGSFPIQVSDVPIGGGLLALDPFDVVQFSLVPPAPTPVALPAFLGGAGRLALGNCVDAPVGGGGPYPDISTLNYNTIKPYSLCTFSWQPDAGGGDDGKKYSYQFTVQDNFNGTPTVMGIGARHPTGPVGGTVPGDNAGKTNGPLTTYNIDIESLETNNPPFYVVNGSGTGTMGGGGGVLATPYASAGGGAGWTSVFAAGGKQPLDAGTACVAGGAFTCALHVSNGDTLQNTSVMQMQEGGGQTFTVYSKDNNVTASLKTLSGVKPSAVLIVDGPFKGKTYAVPSFASMSMNTSQTVNAGTNLPGYATFSFTWTPTDAEANYLSNPGGFLIPVTVSDQQYKAAQDGTFPSTFVTPAMTSTIWIWANVKVVNNAPVVYYMNGATEVPLNSATLTMQTGATTSFTIRVKDTDTARWTQGNIHTDFSPTYNGFLGNGGTQFLSAVTPSGTPYYTAPYIYQNFVITGTPGNADIGTYSAPSVTITDPGDQSQGLATNPDTATPPNAMVSAGVFPAANVLSVPFNVQVIGKPLINVPNPLPNPAGSQVYAYSGKPFFYPMSLSISRPTELLQNFFVGIDMTETTNAQITALQCATTTPNSNGPCYKTGAGSTGMYVNEKYVLRWPDSSFTNIIAPPTRAVPVYAVVYSDCVISNTITTTSAGSKLLVRYNESLGKIETCKITTAQVTADAVNQNVNLMLVDGSSMPTVPTLSKAEVDRTLSTLAAAQPNQLDQQFAEFYSRCANGVCNGTPVTNNTSPSGLLLQAGPGNTGSAEYDFNNYSSILSYTGATSSLVVNKNYIDNAPTNVRNLNLMASKGETLTFKATLNAITGTPHYRWYVNGCLKAAGMATSPNLSFNYIVGSLASGANNDCTGEYNFTETNGALLGKIIVRLSVVNSTETTGTASDNATVNYLYNVNVVNTNPNMQTLTSYAPSKPVTFDATYLSGNMNIQFSMPVTYGGKNYLAYTDLHNTAGLKVKLREFNSNGDLPAGGSSLTLSCAASFTNQPQLLGIQPFTGGNLYISASSYSTANATYPVGNPAATLTYGGLGQTCFSNAFTNPVPSPTQSQNFINFGGASTAPAGYLAFSKYIQTVNPIASYTTAGSPYLAGSNDSSYYFMDGYSAASTFWSYALTDVYGSLPAEIGTTPFGSNIVRKNIVSGTKEFQLIGAQASNTTGWRGFIIGNTIAAGTFPQLSATRQNRIMFASVATSTVTPPLVGANDCQFDGTPLDGVYSAVDDSLYVLANANDITGKGHIVQITNASKSDGSTKCNVIGNVLNPSLNASDHNPNISKMAFDATTGIIYGVINQGTGLSGELFTLDIYTKQLNSLSMTFKTLFLFS